MKKYPHIDAFYQVLKYAKKYGIQKQKYQGTVKLHGSNCGVCVTADGKISTQSRNNDLTVDNDNYGFAKWVLNNPKRVEHFLHLYDEILTQLEVVFYGEFIGPGINNGCAIHQLPKKQFVIFDVNIGDVLHMRIPDHSNNADCNIYTIDTIGIYELDVDFNNPEESIEFINQKTLEVEAECPWGKFFDISGLGEGIVWKPVNSLNTELMFKSKGEKHKNMKPAMARNTTPISENILSFVDEFLTGEVLQQGLDFLKENNKALDKSSTGEYLKFVCSDIARECEDILEESNIKWGEVSPLITKKAREFFFHHME